MQAVPLQDQPALLVTSGGESRFMLPLGSPEFPRQPTRGRVTGVGTSGCTESMAAGLRGMGVRMGAAGMTGTEDRPTDRFGMEPIPGRRRRRRWRHTQMERRQILKTWC